MSRAGGWRQSALQKAFTQESKNRLAGCGEIHGALRQCRMSAQPEFFGGGKTVRVQCLTALNPEPDR
jgi:hypothetical protein